MLEIVPAFQKPSSWFGFLGPVCLYKEIVTRLNAEMVTVLHGLSMQTERATT
jgi:hypothetical protein